MDETKDSDESMSNKDKVILLILFLIIVFFIILMFAFFENIAQISYNDNNIT